jgi:hypothetical protein
MKEPEQIPFKEVTNCEVCQSSELTKAHDKKYAGKEGLYRFVIYKCPRGHETRTRQLVVRTPGVPDPEGWTN